MLECHIHGCLSASRESQADVNAETDSHHSSYVVVALSRTLTSIASCMCQLPTYDQSFSDNNILLYAVLYFVCLL